MALEKIREIVSGDGWSTAKTTQSFQTLRSANQRTIQNAIFPLQNYNHEKEIAAYIAFSNGGKMERYLGKPRNSVAANSGYRISQGMMTWEEEYVLNRDDLEYIESMENALAEMTLGTKIAMGQGLLGDRLNNILEYMCMDTILTGGTQGVTYPVSNHYRLDLNSSASSGYTYTNSIMSSYKWTPGGLWTDLDASEPLKDMSNMLRFFEKISGNKVQKIYVAPDVAHYLRLNSDIWDRFGKLSNTFGGVMDLMALSNLVPWLPPIEEYAGTYVSATTTVATAASATDTSLVVSDYTNIEDGDVLVITEKSTGRVITTEITATVSSVTLTVDALTDAVSAGSVVEVMKNFMPNGHIIFQLGTPSMQKIATVPTIMNGGMNSPQPGPYSMVDMSVYNSDPWVKVVAGAKAAPVVFRAGGFAAARVTDGTNYYI